MFGVDGGSDLEPFAPPRSIPFETRFTLTIPEMTSGREP